MASLTQMIIIALSLNLLCGIISAAQDYQQYQSETESMNAMLQMINQYSETMKNTSQGIQGNEGNMLSTPRQDPQISESHLNIVKILTTVFKIIFYAFVGSAVLGFSSLTLHGTSIEVALNLIISLFLILFNFFVCYEIYQVIVNKKPDKG